MELQLLKQDIAVGEPVEWVESESGTVAAKSILCGTDKIMLILFDTSILSMHQGNQISTPASRKLGSASAVVNVDVPSGYSVDKIRPISRPGSDVRFDINNRRVTIHITLEYSSEILELSLIRKQQ